MKRLLLALIVLLCWPASASAVTITGEGLSRPYQAWADAAKVPTPEFVVRVTEGSAGPCDAPDQLIVPLACNDGTDLWLREISRATFFHELGHLFDQQVLPEWARARFMSLAQVPSLPWIGDGEERFADAYSQCARYQHIRPRWGGYESYVGLIGGKALLKVCRMIRRVG